MLLEGILALTGVRVDPDHVGEIIQDRFTIELDPNLQTGVYDIMLQFYDPSGSDQVGDLTKIGELEIRE